MVFGKTEGAKVLFNRGDRIVGDMVHEARGREHPLNELAGDTYRMIGRVIESAAHERCDCGGEI
jgi:hypothetical protein